MTGNQEDIYFLNNDPNGLILKYQKIISIIVHKKLIVPGYFKIQGKDDLTQAISKQLNEKIPSIKKNYNGSFNLITYCSAIITNLCKEIIKELEKQPKLIYDYSIEKEFDENIIDNMIINDAIDKFDKILRLYHCERFKTEFCLKSYFKVKLMITDFEHLSSNIQLDQVKLIEIFNDISENHKLTKNEIYMHLTLVFNNLENTNNTNDAIRKCIKKSIREILKLLNGNPPESSFDEETLQILIEKYYDSKSILTPYWSIY